MSHPTKKWEVFPGRNKFCLDGKIIMGPDVTVFYINVFLIVGTTFIFLAFDCPFLTIHVSPLIPVATIILFVFVMSALLKTSFTDPGIIPRATADEAMYIEKQIKITACGDTTADRPPPRTKEVLIRGQCVKLKYCFTCKIFRPPRASHCSLCDNCVDNFDHHCPWVGNCVGRRNYRYFYLFTVTLSLYIAFVFICTCAHLYFLSKKNGVMVEAIAESPASVIVLLITFFSCWSVFGLAVFHTYLAASNQTTNEDIKGSFSNKRGGSNRNPYTTGNGCSNCCYVLCGPFTPSLIDSEGFITPDPIDKKLADRQISRINSSPIYEPSTNHNGHYQLNGLKSYSTVNQPNRLSASVISGPQFSRQSYDNRSPTSLSEGVYYCNSRNETIVARKLIESSISGRQDSNRRTVPPFMRTSQSTNHPTALPLKTSNAEKMYSIPESEIAPKSTFLSDKNSNSNLKNISAIYESIDEKNAYGYGYGEQNNVTIDLSEIELDLDDVEALSYDTSKKNTISLEPLSAKKLQLLQDTTMIESALDLDSLEESTSSVGTNSHAGLIKSKQTL